MNDTNVFARYNVRSQGAGPVTLLFVHGFGCDQAMWRFVAPEFAAQQRVVTFDLVGHGGTGIAHYDETRHGSLHGYADDLLEVVHALDAERLIVVAHSVSATIALLASAREPERFERLVLVGPSPCYVNHPPDYIGGFEREDLEDMLETMAKNYTAWAGALAPVIVGNADRPEYAQELETSFCAIDPDVAHQFATVTFLSDHRDDLRAVRTPSLILQCQDDVIAPDTVGTFLSEQLPHATLYRMAATGHCPHLTHPTETVSAIRTYLASAPGVPLPLGGR